MGPTKRVLGAALLAGFAVAAGACPQPAGLLRDGDEPRSGRATLVVVNATGDTWDLRVDAAPRGSVAPRSDAHIAGLPEGEAEVVATNAMLDLVQRGTVVLAADAEKRFELKPVWAALVVRNRQALPVEITVDGAVVGRVDAAATTRFERVPGGRRIIVARVVGAPGAVRQKTTLVPGSELVWEVPALTTGNPVASETPRPPSGQGLVWLRNAGRHAIRVSSGGTEYGRVPPGGTLAMVLAPGTHVLRADLEGLEAHTEETVSLLPNQIAEWVWSE